MGEGRQDGNGLNPSVTGCLDMFYMLWLELTYRLHMEDGDLKKTSYNEKSMIQTSVSFGGYFWYF